MRFRPVRRARSQPSHDQVEESARSSLGAGSRVDAPEGAEDQQHVVGIMTGTDAAVLSTRSQERRDRPNEWPVGLAD